MLKNSYNSVPHAILFERLEQAKIQPEIIKILKMIFKRYSTTKLMMQLKFLQGYISFPIRFNLFIYEVIGILFYNNFKA